MVIVNNPPQKIIQHTCATDLETHRHLTRPEMTPYRALAISHSFCDHTVCPACTMERGSLGTFSHLSL